MIEPSIAVAQPDEPSAANPGSETIEQLFAALESPLLNYALRLTQEMETAQDIVQEAFMRLHAQFQEVRQPRPWLYRTVHNLALNHRRRAEKVVPLELCLEGTNPTAADFPDTNPLPDEQIARWESIGLVRLSLETLDYRRRELIRLKFSENLSYQEIGARLGLTPGHVGYLLHHTLKTIAAELSKNGVMI